MPELELRTLPVLPLKNSVLFPGLMMPLSVGRSASIAAVEAALTPVLIVIMRSLSFIAGLASENTARVPTRLQDEDRKSTRLNSSH